MVTWMVVILVLGGVLAFMPEELLRNSYLLRPLLGVTIMLIAVGIGTCLTAGSQEKKAEEKKTAEKKDEEGKAEEKK